MGRDEEDRLAPWLRASSIIAAVEWLISMPLGTLTLDDLLPPIFEVHVTRVRRIGGVFSKYGFRVLQDRRLVITSELIYETGLEALRAGTERVKKRS